METMTNKLGIEVTLGTVSHGTMRPQDLIPRFLDVLREVDPARYEAYVANPLGAIPAYVHDEGDDSEWWTSEDAGYLLGELFEALNDAAPEGVYFSAHEGDGADYGFWMDDPCFYEEDDTPCDLAFIAQHVTTWPKGAEFVRLDADGEICFGGPASMDTEHDFYPGDYFETSAGEAHPAFLPDRDSGMVWVGKDYTRNEWMASTYGEAFVRGRGPSDTDAMDAINKVLDAEEWSPDSLDAIAEIVRSTGRVIREPDEEVPVTYNHAFSLCFSVSRSRCPEGSDVTAEQLRRSLDSRVADLDSEGNLAWLEAVGAPEDTYEED